MVGMMWFKREPKGTDKVDSNGVVNKFRRKKALLKPTRESSERETSTESDKEKRRHSDIFDTKVSLDRREESEESLYESADCHSDAISASDDALPTLTKTPTISKESLKLAVTDEEVEIKVKKGHRKAVSLSYPLDIVKSLGEELLESSKKEFKKSKESLWSEEDKDSIHGSHTKLDQIRKNSKNEEKNQVGSRKSSTGDPPKTRKTSKASSVSALNIFRRKKTPTSMKVESLEEDIDRHNLDEILNHTKIFLEAERRHTNMCQMRRVVQDTDSDDEPPISKPVEHNRRRLSRQTSRSKSKARGKSQSLKVNTLRKSHSGTLKKSKKKIPKTPLSSRSRQSSIVETTLVKTKNPDVYKHHSWLFSSTRGEGKESRREGSNDDAAPPDGDGDISDTLPKENSEKENSWRGAGVGGGVGGARGVSRAESCRERDAPRRGKHRNASDPNRLTAHHNHDLEPGAATGPSGSSSSSSLSSRSNESNTVAAEHHASQSDWSEEDEPLAAQWADSLPPQILDTLVLSARLRKRQEVIHELIVSEGSHVRWLKVLNILFLRPLESQPTLLSSDELKALFPNLPNVKERHTKLYKDLLATRSDTNYVVQIRPIADAVLNTLGESGYASCLSKFCRGQRMALDALRERRRKNKELHQFLQGREQHPQCGRLQLRDLLACVWQRLTKYQLLLESIAKTVSDDESDSESPEDVSRLHAALRVSKNVLHAVDTAIRSAENDHRLRTIQSKLEVRVSGSDWDELKRLDLTTRSLRMEGELAIRNDTNKKINVWALMLSDSLILLQREGDKFILKPITQPSQQGLLSPLIKWDKVIFRPNAAVRHTFFLMNINGVQMHELSANTPAEYSTWVKYIQESPLAKLTDLKPNITPSHQATKSNDDSGINVSRNPSDASEKSTSTAPVEDTESDRERASIERRSTDREETGDRDDKSDRGEKGDRIEKDVEENGDRKETSVEREEKSKEVERDRDEVVDREEKRKPRSPTTGCISWHLQEPPPLLESTAAVLVSDAAAHTIAHTAHTVLTDQERLRRLDARIARDLRAKSSVVGSLLGVPPHDFADIADLAVADTMRRLDVSGDLRAVRLEGSADSEGEEGEDEVPAGEGARGAGGAEPDLHQLLLAAQVQANQLTEAINKALSLSESATIAARSHSSAGRCDSCRRRAPKRTSTRRDTTRSLETPEIRENSIRPESDRVENAQPRLTREPSEQLMESALEGILEKDISFDMLSELEDKKGERSDDDIEDIESSAALAVRLAPLVLGVQAAVGGLVRAVTQRVGHEHENELRRELAVLRDRSDALHAANNKRQQSTDNSEVHHNDDVDHVIHDQANNGG